MLESCHSRFFSKNQGVNHRDTELTEEGSRSLEIRVTLKACVIATSAPADLRQVVRQGLTLCALHVSVVSTAGLGLSNQTRTNHGGMEFTERKP